MKKKLLYHKPDKADSIIKYFNSINRKSTRKVYHLTFLKFFATSSQFTTLNQFLMYSGRLF